jgi:hypothetical protein
MRSWAGRQISATERLNVKIHEQHSRIFYPIFHRARPGIEVKDEGVKNGKQVTRMWRQRRLIRGGAGRRPIRISDLFRISDFGLRILEGLGVTNLNQDSTQCCSERAGYPSVYIERVCRVPLSGSVQRNCGRKRLAAKRRKMRKSVVMFTPALRSILTSFCAGQGSDSRINKRRDCLFPGTKT